jgi:hypothetical protein
LISDTVGISWEKWYKSCLRPSEVLDVNGRHLGFTFLIDRMTEVLAPDIYGDHCIVVGLDIFILTQITTGQQRLPLPSCFWIEIV